ncbi:carboxypeptidase-like regulatory domain-containing protein [Streptomyces sp. NPDC008079]|uniref:carboxypeptidase-like regulatory domain-containing protein n=1 Tax=Streptomyces sp. NPDC008079 TaxID=3364806 RepID=UPI0036EADAD2
MIPEHDEQIARRPHCACRRSSDSRSLLWFGRAGEEVATFSHGAVKPVRGLVKGVVRLADGSVLPDFVMEPKAISSVEVRSIAMITNHLGRYSLSLLPGIYVIRTHGIAEARREWTGESHEVTVEAGQVVHVDVTVRPPLHRPASQHLPPVS